MNKIRCILILVLLTTAIRNDSLFAQKDTIKDYSGGVFITLPIEFPIIDNGQLNTHLIRMGYPKSNYPSVNAGIGLQFFINRWIMNLSFIQTTKTSERDRYSTDITYNSGSFSVGFDLIEHYMYSLYPYVGFKGCGLKYLYKDKITNDIGFDDYLNTTLTYKEIKNHTGSNIDFGIGASFQWFFLVNFRVGFLLPLEKGKWTINNLKQELTGTPKLNYNYYFTLTLGFGMVTSDKALRNRFDRLNREIPLQGL